MNSAEFWEIFTQIGMVVSLSRKGERRQAADLNEVQRYEQMVSQIGGFVVFVKWVIFDSSVCL